MADYPKRSTDGAVLPPYDQPHQEDYSCMDCASLHLLEVSARWMTHMHNKHGAAATQEALVAVLASTLSAMLMDAIRLGKDNGPDYIITEQDTEDATALFNKLLDRIDSPPPEDTAGARPADLEGMSSTKH